MSTYRYGRGEILPGDHAWGGGIDEPRPVVRVNPAGIVLGLQRGNGGWAQTRLVNWAEVRGHLPVGDEPHDLAERLMASAHRVRHGFLDYAQREQIAALLEAAAGVPTLPAAVTAALASAIDVLDRPASPVGGR